MFASVVLNYPLNTGSEGASLTVTTTMCPTPTTPPSRTSRRTWDQGARSLPRHFFPLHTDSRDRRRVWRSRMKDQEMKYAKAKTTVRVLLMLQLLHEKTKIIYLDNTCFLDFASLLIGFVRNLFSCPTRWSLYLPLAFCIDHPINRETGYSNVLVRKPTI